MKTSESIAKIAPALLKAQRSGDRWAEAKLLRELLPMKERAGQQHASKPLHMRIMESVVFSSGDCWIWRRVVNGFGYGRMTYKGRTQVVHRLAYEAWNGPIPDGMSVLHSCDNPSCCNPEHLHLGTYSDNIREAYQRGRRKPRSKQ